MFRKQYKGAYDEIKGNRDCIDKIFSSSAGVKKGKVIPFRYATTIVAALVALFVVVAYPDFTEHNEPKEKQLNPVNIEEYKFPTVENANIISGNEEEQPVAFDEAKQSSSYSDSEQESATAGVKVVSELSRITEEDKGSSGGSSAQEIVVLENGKVATVTSAEENQEILARLENEAEEISGIFCIMEENDGKQALYAKTENGVLKFEFSDFSEEDIKALAENIK